VGVAPPLLTSGAAPTEESVLGILALSFAVQSKGRVRIGALFGPIEQLWFVVIALLGLAQIVFTPKY